MAAKLPKGIKHCQAGEYKGNDLLVFTQDDADEPDRYPFQFGAGKAEKLLNCIEASGTEKFLDALYALTGREKPAKKPKRASAKPDQREAA